jgi:hypothetical protein
VITKLIYNFYSEFLFLIILNINYQIFNNIEFSYDGFYDFSHNIYNIFHIVISNRHFFLFLLFYLNNIISMFFPLYSYLYNLVFILLSFPLIYINFFYFIYSIHILSHNYNPLFLLSFMNLFFYSLYVNLFFSLILILLSLYIFLLLCYILYSIFSPYTF